MIKQDYKPKNNQEFSRDSFRQHIPEWLTHPFLIIGMAVCVLALALVLMDSEPQPESLMVVEAVNQTIEKQSEYGDPIDIPLALEKIQVPEDQLVPLFVEQIWQSEIVKKGDNLSLIFKRIGLSPQQVYQVINLDENSKRLKNLKPGDAFFYQIDENRNILALKYIIDVQQTLYIEKQDDQLVSRIENKSIEIRPAYAKGVIEDSLFVSGKNAGLTDSQVMQLANIFDWDIDFILDIRKGDSFSMLYEEKYVEGEHIGSGEILAAEFINQGKTYAAVLYTDTDNVSNYYTPEGLSMRKAFLRAPLKFSYISSNFKLKRFHPIQKRWKAHRGIDYRAPTGTPIRAAGDGKVIASSYDKYNGKYVFIQHGQGIVTKYLHMSKRAVSKSKRVKQGQVIGYVGSTGMSEAPHLHYEFVVNGVHRNPRTVSLPKAEPVRSSEKERFTQSTRRWIEQLASINAVQNSPETVAP